ncbi:integrator complex subunit 12 [Eupeodes corollae]|uniref:integrator complex subunit 12 n=1 Tax=Eupeodes corollae TaxID=290404 RepID=UPI002491BF43|nr:integrator complex subunit 12 [Eupeodes corollae]
MAAATELDSSLKQALNFLHSTNPQSAEEIRNCLDDIIKQRYGSSKMLANTISQKHLDEEPQAPGTIALPIEVEDLTLTQSPKTITDSPNTIAESDDMGGALTISEEVENLKEFGDLKCVVCGEMIVTATNRLIECSKCVSLYHQNCHKPNITDEEADEQELSWTCSNCQNKTPVVAKIVLDDPIPLLKPKSSSASSSRSSSSSTSSSPYYRQEHSSSSSSRHNKGISSKKSSSSRDPTNSGVSSSKSSTSSSVVTPSINVISAADKTGYSSKKSSHSSGSSSSKSKSKHHESSSGSGGSSKRKSSK